MRFYFSFSFMNRHLIVSQSLRFGLTLKPYYSKLIKAHAKRLKGRKAMRPSWTFSRNPEARDYNYYIALLLQ